MKNYRVALIGCGKRAPDYINAYDLIDNAEVVACCAPSSKHREPLSKQYNIAAYANPVEMIKQEKPDMVHIITWPKTRFELMNLVSKQEVPLCTVEKPIARGVSDWKRLALLRDQSETLFGVCHQYRWHPHFSKCQQALARGTLGEVRLIDMSARMNIACQGTHILNYGMALNQNTRVKEIFGNIQSWDLRDRGHPAPKGSIARLVFENNVEGIWTTGPHAPSINPSLEQPWKHKRVKAYSDLGWLNWEQFGEWEISGPNEQEKGNCGTELEFKRNEQLAQAGFHRAMFSWYEEGIDPGVTLKQSLHEWSVVLALYQSALAQKPIKMADFNPSQFMMHQLRYSWKAWLG